MDKIYPEEHIQAIANAIRRKNGRSVNYLTSEMAGAIDQLVSYPEPTGTQQITENGIVDVKDKAYAEVNVAGSTAVLISKTITANGEYDAEDDEADGYSDVTVNVPNSYDASDEGKVVSSGALVAQTSATKTENGTYDTTLNNEIVVNVSGGVDIEGEIPNKAGTFFGDSLGNAATSLSVTLDGDEGELAVLVVMHRDTITLSSNMTLVDSTKNENFEQYISVYTKVMGSTSETITITQASAVRICALTMYMKDGTEIGAPAQQAPDSGASIEQYTISRSSEPKLVVISGVNKTDGATTAITGDYESLLPNLFGSSCRLSAFFTQKGTGNAVWSESEINANVRLYNRAFIYPLSGTLSVFEGEVVQSEKLVRQSSRIVTQNGTIDTTLNNEVVVSVSGGGGSTYPPFDALYGGSIGGCILAARVSAGIVIFFCKYAATKKCLFINVPLNLALGSVSDFEDALDAIPDAPTSGEYSGYIYGNTGIITDCNLVLLGDFSQGGASSGNTLSDSIENYSAVILQGIYSKQRNSGYNTSMLYMNPTLNNQYWAGMKDRNSSYTCNVTFTDDTHASLSGNKQVIIYGVP